MFNVFSNFLIVCNVLLVFIGSFFNNEFIKVNNSNDYDTREVCGTLGRSVQNIYEINSNVSIDPDDKDNTDDAKNSADTFLSVMFDLVNSGDAKVMDDMLKYNMSNQEKSYNNSFYRLIYYNIIMHELSDNKLKNFEADFFNSRLDVNLDYNDLVAVREYADFCREVYENLTFASMRPLSEEQIRVTLNGLNDNFRKEFEYSAIGDYPIYVHRDIQDSEVDASSSYLVQYKIDGVNVSGFITLYICKINGKNEVGLISYDITHNGISHQEFRQSAYDWLTHMGDWLSNDYSKKLINDFPMRLCTIKHSDLLNHFITHDTVNKLNNLIYNVQ